MENISEEIIQYEQQNVNLWKKLNRAPTHTGNTKMSNILDMSAWGEKKKRMQTGKNWKKSRLKTSQIWQKIYSFAKTRLKKLSKSQQR